MWGNRNQFLHNNTNPAYITKQEEKINLQVSTEFKKNINGIAPSEQHIFDITQAEIFDLPVCRKRQWIQSVKVARKRAKVRNLNYNIPLFYSAEEEESYKRRKIILRKSAHPNFRKWWLRHHPYLSCLPNHQKITHISSPSLSSTTNIKNIKRNTQNRRLQFNMSVNHSNT